jgi:poly(hydroxyalkanoate) depolymerase family esterase
VVAYPAQATSANLSKCWNWFSEADQQRGRGEPSLIAGIARDVMADLSVDASRVNVAGLSAGGAAAAVLGATYPDVFKAIGVHSGLACGAARDMPSAFVAMKNGAPAQGTFAARGASVPTIVFHGDGDRTVHPVNGDHVIAQSKAAKDLRARSERGVSPGGMRYTRTIYADVSGKPAHEQWLLHGAGHAWSGGSSSGSFTEPRGPDASREMMRFFLERSA